MPNNMFLIGAVGLFLLSRMRNGNNQPSGEGQALGDFFRGGGYDGTAELINASNQASGEGTFGNNSAQGQSAPNLGSAATYEVFSGNTIVTAEVLDATTPIPNQADNINDTGKSIAGPLSPFFNVTGPTISEISGSAVRQVGILSPYESGIVKESNYPQIAFIDVNMNGSSGPLVGDEPIEVVAPMQGVPEVVTILGDDGSTVVTTGVNRSTTSYFSTADTIVESINQGYFSAPEPYEARTVLEIEQSWAESPEGIASREAQRGRIADAYALVANLGNNNGNSQAIWEPNVYSTWEE